MILNVELSNYSPGDDHMIDIGFIASFLLFGLTYNPWISIGGASFCAYLGSKGFDLITDWLKQIRGINK